MVKQRLERVSGAQGELSPLLRARVNDLAKAGAADARLENLTPLPEGARTRTPGTRFIAPWKDETRPARLMDFEVSLGDSYMLAFNGGVMRVFRNQAPILIPAGTAPYELAHPFPDNQLDALFKAQVKGTMFIAGGGRPRVLVRNLDNDWSLTEYVPTEAPVRLQNTDKTWTIQASAETGTVTLTASKATFLAGHVGSIWRLDEADLSTVPNWKAIESPIAVGQRRRNKGRIYEVVTLNATTGDTGPNPPVHDDGDVFSSGGNVTWRFISNTGGYVRITAVASPTSATAIVLDRLPQRAVTAPSYRWFEAAWSDVRGWPDAVSVSDQSLVWTRNNEYFISRPTDLYSFDLLDEEDSAITAAINAPDGKLTEIVWVLPIGVLVLGARSNEWLIRGAQNAFERLTPTNQRAIPQGSRGSFKPHQPVMVDGGAVFIGRGGRSLHFVRFDGATEQIEFQNFTTFSRQMLRAGARQLAWCQDPNPVLWVRMADGTLRGLTLMTEQDVAGWHRRPMINGKGDRRGSTHRRRRLARGLRHCHRSGRRPVRERQRARPPRGAGGQPLRRWRVSRPSHRERRQRHPAAPHAQHPGRPAAGLAARDPAFRDEHPERLHQGGREGRQQRDAAPARNRHRPHLGQWRGRRACLSDRRRVARAAPAAFLRRPHRDDRGRHREGGRHRARG